MKTLTKILSVTALIVLCVCLFTLTAFAAGTITATYDKVAENKCTVMDKYAGFELDDGTLWKVPDTGTLYGIGAYLPDSQIQSEGYTKISSLSELNKGYGAHQGGGVIGPVAPDCSHDGIKAHQVCSVCNEYLDSTGTVVVTRDSLTDPATGAHTWVLIEEKPATQTRGGYKLYRCSKCLEEYTEPTGIDTNPPLEEEPLGEDVDATLWSVIPIRDTWFRGEETLLFRSDLIKWLNDHGHGTNRVGLRIGNDRSLYDGTYYTFDFWSWEDFVEFGDKMLNGLEEGTYYLWIYDREDPDRHTNAVPFYVVDVPTLEPYSTDKHVVNSSKSLRFVASEEIDPNSVKVGSKKLYDSNDYFVSNDRKNITLSPDFLNARQTGTYTISARTKGGETIKTNFYILSTAQASSSPRTGDESQIGLWAAFLLLSGAAIVVMVPKLRKHGAK